MLYEAQVWFNGYQKNSGVMLPKGTYQLEAQDSDYLYFRAPLDIEFRSLNVTPPTQELVKGGIAIASRLYANHYFPLNSSVSCTSLTPPPKKKAAS